METLCKQLQLTHGHRLEEQLRTDRLIKAFRKKQKRLNRIAQKEDEERKVMAEKFDKELRLRFQEEVEKQKLKAAQELCKEEERKLEEVVKQLSAEHGMAEEDIRLKCKQCRIYSQGRSREESGERKDRGRTEEIRGDGARKRRSRRKEENRADGADGARKRRARKRTELG